MGTLRQLMETLDVLWEGLGVVKERLYTQSDGDDAQDPRGSSRLLSRLAARPQLLQAKGSREDVHPDVARGSVVLLSSLSQVTKRLVDHLGQSVHKKGLNVFAQSLHARTLACTCTCHVYSLSARRYSTQVPTKAPHCLEARPPL